MKLMVKTRSNHWSYEARVMGWSHKSIMLGEELLNAIIPLLNLDMDHPNNDSQNRPLEQGHVQQNAIIFLFCLLLTNQCLCLKQGMPLSVSNVSSAIQERLPIVKEKMKGCTYTELVVANHGPNQCWKYQYHKQHCTYPRLHLLSLFWYLSLSPGIRGFLALTGTLMYVGMTRLSNLIKE